jgi:hypothetical protein
MGVILGDQIKKIIAENKGLSPKMTVTNNVKVTNVRKQEYSLSENKKDPGLAFDFVFTSQYGETQSKVEIEGSIFYVGGKQEIDDIEKVWKDRKVVSEKIAIPIHNRALEIGFLQAIDLSTKVKLPAPIQLPRFVAEEKPAVPEKQVAKK